MKRFQEKRKVEWDMGGKRAHLNLFWIDPTHHLYKATKIPYTQNNEKWGISQLYKNTKQSNQWKLKKIPIRYRKNVIDNMRMI